MQYIKTLAGVLLATLFVTTAFAGDLKGPQFDKNNLFGLSSTNSVEPWTLTLGGGGVTTTSGDSQSAFGANFQLGHVDTLILPGEVGLRQSFGWASTPNKNGGDWLLSTSVYQDWKVLSYKSFDLLAGGNVAAGYGNRTLGWTVGPEVEARLWLKKDVFTFFRTSYNFDLNSSGFRSQDTLGYVLGLGFKF